MCAHVPEFGFSKLLVTHHVHSEYVSYVNIDHSASRYLIFGCMNMVELVIPEPILSEVNFVSYIVAEVFAVKCTII